MRLGEEPNNGEESLKWEGPHNGEESLEYSQHPSWPIVHNWPAQIEMITSGKSDERQIHSNKIKRFMYLKIHVLYKCSVGMFGAKFICIFDAFFRYIKLFILFEWTCLCFISFTNCYNISSTFLSGSQSEVKASGCKGIFWTTLIILLHEFGYIPASALTNVWVISSRNLKIRKQNIYEGVTDAHPCFGRVA